MTIMVFDEVCDLIQNLPSPSTSLPIIIGDLIYHFKSPIHGPMLTSNSQLSMFPYANIHN